MPQANENGLVAVHQHLVFTGLTSEGQPNYYVVEGNYWKPGGREVNSCGLPEGWLVLDSNNLSTFQVPKDFNPTAAAVNLIDAEIQSLRAETEVRIQDLIHKKNELLNLGYDAGSVSEVVGNDFEF